MRMVLILETSKVYNVDVIEKCHWSELNKLFGLITNGDLDVDEKILEEFLWNNSNCERSHGIAEVLRIFLTKLATKTNSYEDEIYLAIAKCQDDFTVTKWFAKNIRTFYC